MLAFKTFRPSTTFARRFSTQKASAPAPAITVSDFLSTLSAKNKYRDLIRDSTQEVRWSWPEFNSTVDAFAHGLLSNRLSPKEKLAIYLPNELENMVLQFAAARAGIVYASIRNPVSAQNLEKTLQALNPKGFALAAKADAEVTFLREFLPELNSWPRGLPYRNNKFPTLRTIIHTGSDLIPGALRFKDIRQDDLLESPLGEALCSYTPQDVAAIYVGSDLSKNNSFTHQNLLSNARTIAGELKLSSDDRVGFLVPFDTMGGHVAFLAVLSSSAFVVLPSRFAERTLRNLVTDSATVLFATATQLRELLKVEQKRPSSSITRLIIAQGPEYGQLSSSEASALSAYFPKVKVLSSLYFLPQAGAVFSSSGVDSKAIGKPLSEVEVRVDSSGVLAVKGPSVAVGTSAEGWVTTDVKVSAGSSNQYSLL